jgi:N6-adenosine-specific RNA methylase IME4
VLHLLSSTKCKYKTIVIDPPWEFVDHGNTLPMQGGNLLDHPPYKTMTEEEILKFPINDFADIDCSLFLWSIHSKLPFIFCKLLPTWGFKYHVLLTWDKLSGMCIKGFYRRTELVVHAYKGKFGIDSGKGNYLPTLFSGRPKEHSQKPDKLYSLLRDRTEEPRIDIFARKRHFGFDAYGDQVETSMTVPLLIASYHAQEKVK